MRLAVIPARGGSKRIPRKNIRPFCGRPMIAWPIAAAVESGCFDRITVSTDDPEIADVARGLGAEIPFMRPAHLADDHATSVAVIAHAVAWHRVQGADLDAVCCLYATAPFVRAEDLRAGLTELQSGRRDYVFPVASFSFPIQRALRRDASGGVEMFDPQYLTTRSQDLEEAFHDAGQFYWGLPEAWAEQRPVYSRRSGTVVLPRWRVQDIDTPEDWERSELMFEAMAAQARRSAPAETLKEKTASC